MRRALLPALALALFAVSAGAQPFDTITAHGGLLLIANGVEGGAPSALVPPLGAWVPVSLTDAPRVYWEAGVMLMGLTYRYEGDRGVPVEIEAANSFWVLGLMGDLRALYLWPLSDKVLLGPTGGLAVLLRIPVMPYDEAASDWGSLAGFFLARSLFPEIGAAVRWQLLERVGLAAQLRVLYPLHNLWDADTPSAADHLIAGVVVGLQIKL